MDTGDTNSDTANPERLKAHIQQQLQAGLQPNEIAQQLRAAGWGEGIISQAFGLVQAQIVPGPPAVPEPIVQTNAGSTVLPGSVVTTNASPGQQPNQNMPKRGRTKTGWLLFKQSWKVLRSDEGLVRYVIMSAIYSVLLAIIYILVMILGHKIFLTTTNTATNTKTISLMPLGYVPTIIFYIFSYFVINLYAAGLAANVLDLFHGNKQPYGFYMKKARSRAGTLFVFSLIEATIGLVLRAIAERSKLLGRIVTWVLGAVWSLARLFVVPIIVSSDEGAVEAIKDSTKLLVSTWGENLVGRVSMGGVLFLFYLLIMIPLSIILIILGALAGGAVGAIISLIIVIMSILVFSIISSAVSSVLNTALFYYARNRQVPAAFDADLLNSVFQKRKRGLFGKKIT